MRKPKNMIVFYRMKSLMSQQDVADHLELSQSYYGRLERNPKNMSIGLVMQLKQLFNAESIDEMVSDLV